MAEEMKKPDIGLLALDIDGTLMNAQKQFPPVNCRALQECERRGIRIALVSGRSFELMREFARELGVHPIMCACNGSRIEAGENGPTLAEFTFDRACAERICRTMELDEKYASVIVQRYVDLVGSSANVSVLRDGQTLSFDKVTAKVI